MSGGVDSSVTAALLKREGYEVIGVFMRNWREDEHCPSQKDYEDASKVCDLLKIPLYSHEFVEEYWKSVFEECLQEFQAGRTPNPDIGCNREIKFRHLFETAKVYGASFLATGHYARLKAFDSSENSLLRGKDELKDQSYFLYAVRGQTLKSVLFPVGELEKSQVRALARELHLPTREKKDSMGICFVGDRKFRPFLSQFLKPKPGAFVDLAGKEVGRHEGAHFYTIGQRRGLGLGGEGARWFVIRKDMQKNLVWVARGDSRGQDPAELFHSKLLAERLEWVNPRAITETTLAMRAERGTLTAKIRYRQRDEKVAAVRLLTNGSLEVDFQNPQRAITPGQSIVFYDLEVCLGGAIIQDSMPSS
jgi:tRNA-specific 2-thiouridylase